MANQTSEAYKISLMEDNTLESNPSKMWISLVQNKDLDRIARAKLESFLRTKLLSYL